MNFVVSAFLVYLKSHPETVEKLVEALVEAIIKNLNPNPPNT